MIACIGELLSEREAGKTTEVVSRQIKAIAGMYCTCFLFRAISVFYLYELGDQEVIVVLALRRGGGGGGMQGGV